MCVREKPFPLQSHPLDFNQLSSGLCCPSVMFCFSRGADISEKLLKSRVALEFTYFAQKSLEYPWKNYDPGKTALEFQCLHIV